MNINANELNRRLQFVLEAQALAHQLSDDGTPAIEIKPASEPWRFNLTYVGDIGDLEPAFRDPEAIHDVWIDNLVTAVRTMDGDIETELRKLQR